MLWHSQGIKDPKHYFSQIDLPKPSYFPSPEELGLQSAKLSKQILASWNTLRIIVERREATLRK